MLGILFGKTLEVILQHLLPSPFLAKHRGRKAVGKRLIRIAWLLDDFAEEYARLRTALAQIGAKNEENFMHYIDKRYGARLAFERLTRLTERLAKELEDLKYLKLFDSEFYETLIDSYAGDEHVHVELGDLLLRQLESIDYRLSVDQCSLVQDIYYRQAEGTTKLFTEPSRSTKGFDLARPERSQELLKLVSTVEESIVKSQRELASFIASNFVIEDLFAVRRG